jgi:hypothetical protein
MRWISVKDRLPEDYERVVVIMWAHNDRPDPVVDHITPRNFLTATGEDISYPVWSSAPYQVTHWCHLPSMPCGE